MDGRDPSILGWLRRRATAAGEDSDGARPPPIEVGAFSGRFGESPFTLARTEEDEGCDETRKEKEAKGDETNGTELEEGRTSSE